MWNELSCRIRNMRLCPLQRRLHKFYKHKFYAVNTCSSNVNTHTRLKVFPQLCKKMFWLSTTTCKLLLIPVVLAAVRATCVLAVDIATAVGLLIITANTLPDTVQQASAFCCVIFAINIYILNFYVIPSFFCFSNLRNLLFILYVVNCK